MKQPTLQSRRVFLRDAAMVAAGAVISSILPWPVRADDAAPSTRTAAAPASWPPLTAAAKALQQKLVGPIYSNPCPFKTDLSLDDDAQRRGISRALEHGIRIFACTAGNTLYATLNLNEVRQVNRVMIEAVGGKGLAIAATGDWSTPDTVEFARFAEAAGADALQIMRPVRTDKSDDDAFAHYETVARSTRLPIVVHGRLSDSLFRRLLQIDSFAARKEDFTLEDLIREQVDFGHRVTIFGGGAEDRFLVGRPYGMHAYYSTYSTFAPKVAMDFWNAIQAGDEKRAVQITLGHDYPFIRRFTHPLWHATLEYFEIGTRAIRPPHKPFTDEQMKEVKVFFDQQGVSPADYRS